VLLEIRGDGHGRNRSPASAHFGVSGGRARDDKIYLSFWVKTQAPNFVAELHVGFKYLSVSPRP
jgi:hypothetical protein